MSKDETEFKTWERARKPEQIEVRREAILAAAIHLLDNGGVDAAGLSAIAREANLSKANLYRYFESREAILLEVLLTELADWAATLEMSLYALSGSGDISEVAQVMADSLENRTRFCDLLASLASVLERNLSVETIQIHKRELKCRYIDLIRPLQAALPQLSKSQANEFLIMNAMFQIGLWPHANPPTKVAKVLEMEEFADLRMDFADRIRWHSLILLRGLETIDPPRMRPE